MITFSELKITIGISRIQKLNANEWLRVIILESSIFLSYNQNVWLSWQIDPYVGRLFLQCRNSKPTKSTLWPRPSRHTINCSYANKFWKGYIWITRLPRCYFLLHLCFICSTISNLRQLSLYAQNIKHIKNNRPFLI